MSSNSEELDSKRLLNFLSALDEDLDMKITLVAVGGTAMTLLNAKASTIDVDFTMPHEFCDEFKRVLDLNQPGFRVDAFHGSLVYITDLPENYLEKATRIKVDFKNIELKTLNPIDIILTKIARMKTRDAEDIETCIKKFHLKENEIRARAEQVQYAGNEKVWGETVERVLNEFCKK